MSDETRSRLEILRKLLESGEAGTQDEIVTHLGKRGFDVTQSTVSRDLRRIGAVKALNEGEETVYRLPGDTGPPLPPLQTGLGELIREIAHNGSLIVIHTAPGSASLVAALLDHARPGGILGTIAGDDTIFVAPGNTRDVKTAVEAIRESVTRAR